MKISSVKNKIILSRKTVNFLNHNFLVLYKGGMSPIVTIKEKLDINLEEIKKELKQDLFNFIDFCKEFNFKGDKTAGEEFSEASAKATSPSLHSS